jgi:hypothetical protein
VELGGVFEERLAKQMTAAADAQEPVASGDDIPF